ncbi:acyltransferase family protein [Streptomyces alkaliphilus]|uniref:acyltransferase family protein n=1 Tax=Streptomyces alkaliphilus TaxID=1472722 RepID=UPI00117EFEE4|nr:acyltransferase family protein [Streptomyces alkaliphilus]MQS06442.1 hypothetical protein [Streptomyces alkaliphilus]
MISLKRKKLGKVRSQKKYRDPWWDNVRYFSGTLVVLGHTIEPLRHQEGPLWLYLVSWALRLPVFVMVCGYFSTAGPLTAREIRRIVESIALPYIFFTILQSLQVLWLTGTWRMALGLPRWALWFLLSLIVWRVMLPYIAALRFPFTIAVIGALAVGYFNEFGSEFSTSRTVAFFPFFILGWKIRNGLFSDFFGSSRTRLPSAALIGASAVVCWFVKDDIRLGWLTMAAPYGTQAEVLGTPFAWLFRAGLLLWGMILGISLINLVPRGRIPVITYLGAGGMYIYLLHPLVLRPLREFGYFDAVDTRGEQILTVLGAIVLAALLASPPLRRLARPVVQPNMPWLFSSEIRKKSGRRKPTPPATETTGSPGEEAPPERTDREKKVPAQA